MRASPLDMRRLGLTTWWWLLGVHLVLTTGTARADVPSTCTARADVPSTCLVDCVAEAYHDSAAAIDHCQNLGQKDSMTCQLRAKANYNAAVKRCQESCSTTPTASPTDSVRIARLPIAR